MLVWYCAQYHESMSGYQLCEKPCKLLLCVASVSSHRYCAKVVQSVTQPSSKCAWFGSLGPHRPGIGSSTRSNPHPRLIRISVVLSMLVCPTTVLSPKTKMSDFITVQTLSLS
eukprot:2496742-Amphidinium_carterae.1